MNESYTNGHGDPRDREKSAEFLEREIDSARAKMARHVDIISDELSPGQLLDQALSMVRSNGTELASNLGVQVKRNPIPLLLASIGTSWLIFESSRTARYPYQAYDNDWDDDLEGDGYATDDMYGYADANTRMAAGNGSLEESGSVDGNAGNLRHRRLGDKVDHLKDKAHTMKERGKDALDDTRESLQHARDKTVRSGRHAKNSARQHYRQMKSETISTGQKVQHFIQEQPIAAASIGLGIGAMLAALIPPTEMEDRTVGSTRDKMMEKADEEIHQKVVEKEDKAREKLDSATASIKSKVSGSDTGTPRDDVSTRQE